MVILLKQEVDINLYIHKNIYIFIAYMLWRFTYTCNKTKNNN